MVQSHNVPLVDDELDRIRLQLRRPSQEYRDVFVPEQFRDHVMIHYVKAALRLGPPVLAIQGETGQGKTYQTLATFSRHNIHVLLLTGSDLSGRYEGSPVRQMDKAYEHARAESRLGNKKVAVVIDDFDNSVASVLTSNRDGYTVNTQLLTDYLMKLSDKSSHGDRPVPMVVTGNNFLGLCEPLARHGRMSFFTWRGPSGEDKLRIVKTIFSDIAQDDLNQLLREFGDQSLAFFDELLSTSYDDSIKRAIREPEQLDLDSVASKIYLSRVSIRDLIETGRQLSQSRPGDFLSTHTTVDRNVVERSNPTWRERNG